MKLLRYLFVGGTAAMVDIGLFFLLTKNAGWPWFPVAVLSFTLATFVNYVLSIRHVFKSGVRFTRGRELVLVYLVSGVGLIINQSVLWLGIEWLSSDFLAAKVSATGAVFFWNYAARIRFIFREPVRRSDRVADAELACCSAHANTPDT